MRPSIAILLFALAACDTSPFDTAADQWCLQNPEDVACEELVVTSCVQTDAVQFDGRLTDSKSFAPWSAVQFSSDSGLPISQFFTPVNTPSRSGTWVAQLSSTAGLRLPQGSPYDGTNLVWSNAEEVEGTEVVYTWSTYFPAGWSVGDFAPFLMQVRSDLPGPIAVRATGEGMFVTVTTQDRSNAASSPDTRDYEILTGGLARDTWHDLAVHVRFSSNPAVGQITVWHRPQGELVFRRAVREQRATLSKDASGAPVKLTELALGVQQIAGQGPDHVIFHDGLRKAADFCDAFATFPSP